MVFAPRIHPGETLLTCALSEAPMSPCGPAQDHQRIESVAKGRQAHRAGSPSSGSRHGYECESTLYLAPEVLIASQVLLQDIPG